MPFQHRNTNDTRQIVYCNVFISFIWQNFELSWQTQKHCMDEWNVQRDECEFQLRHINRCENLHYSRLLLGMLRSEYNKFSNKFQHFFFSYSFSIRFLARFFILSLKINFEYLLNFMFARQTILNTFGIYLVCNVNFEYRTKNSSGKTNEVGERWIKTEFFSRFNFYQETDVAIIKNIYITKGRSVKRKIASIFSA